MPHHVDLVYFTLFLPEVRGLLLGDVGAGDPGEVLTRPGRLAAPCSDDGTWVDGNGIGSEERAKQMLRQTLDAGTLGEAGRGEREIKSLAVGETGEDVSC